MPDMYRSPAIEAYVDYGQDPYQVGEETAEGQRMSAVSAEAGSGNHRLCSGSEMDVCHALRIPEHGSMATKRPV